MNLHGMQPRAVILAAGESRRMGGQKLLMNFRGRPMIEYALEAARARHPLVVAASEVAGYLSGRAGIDVIVNDAPQRGMAHSLALADAAIPPDRSIVVLLGDKPLASERLVEAVCAQGAQADVVFPRDPHSGEPGHPVLFSARARAKIAELPDGDSLRSIRDDPALVRVELSIADRGAYLDVDTAGELAE